VVEKIERKEGLKEDCLQNYAQDEESRGEGGVKTEESFIIAVDTKLRE